MNPMSVNLFLRAAVSFTENEAKVMGLFTLRKYDILKP
jgi:hypothetical protein